MKWDEWRGNLEGKPTFWIKRLVYIPLWKNKKGKRLGLRIDLHKFVGTDDAGCFHSHPAWAIRIPFYGGYVEEVYFGEGVTQFVPILPWTIGIISPAFVHRAHYLIKRVSYSLWLRGPVVADAQLIGPGWPKEMTSPQSTTI